MPICGAAELVNRCVNGYVCVEQDEGRLRENMAKLLSRETCEAMGRASRTRVEPYSLERMSERYMDLYASLLGRAA
jgi:glycosyltransferase involved in cell wall biosynthesis